MSAENYLAKYRAQYGSIRFEDGFNRASDYVVVEVTPRTDRWLTEAGRSWDEVDSILEGRLQVLQGAFESPQQSAVKVAESYGIEHGVSGNMARFLAHVELFDEYQFAFSWNLGKAKSLRSTYEEEKSTIQKGPGRPGAKRKKIHDRWVEEYNSQIDEHTKTSEVAKKVKDLVLRKAVLDIFSQKNNSSLDGRPLVVQDFPKIIDDVKTTLEDRASGNSEQQKNLIDQFITALAEYIRSVRDEGLFAKYAYRTTSGLVATRQDCEVIDAILSFMQEPQNLSVYQSTQVQLRELGNSYINFLARRAEYFSQTKIVEEYPYLSLLYDTYTAALYRGKPSIISSVSGSVEPRITGAMNVLRIKEEANKLAQERSQAIVAIYEYICKNPKFFSLKAESFSDIPEEIILYNTNNGGRIFIGFMSLSLEGSSGKKVEFVGGSKAASVVVHRAKEEIQRNIKRLLGTTASDPDFAQSVVNASAFYNHSISSRLDIEVDLADLFLSHVSVVDSFSKHIYKSIPQTSRQDVKSLYNEITYGNINLKNMVFLRKYLREYWREPESETAEIERENDYLWKEILDNSIWFVSPRGDRFSKNRDPYLEERGIDSVTYSIDPKHPREHRVGIRFSGLGQEFFFWLDSRRIVLGARREVLSVDPVLMQTMTNLLLKRLYFVTSGVLSHKTEEGGEEDGSRIPEYKRAHYRFLTSTAGRPITMESHGAQVHAKEVKDQYGIDIFAEMKRRRAVGTLPPNQYLTFVKETTPGVQGLLILPNELTFDADLIKLPVFSGSR